MIATFRCKNKKRKYILLFFVIFYFYFDVGILCRTINNRHEVKAQENVSNGKKENSLISSKKAIIQEHVSGSDYTSETENSVILEDETNIQLPTQANGNEKIWIVDKPAWTEEVTRYKKEYIGKYICESEVGIKFFDTNKDASDYQYWCAQNGILCNYYWDDYAFEIEVPYIEEIYNEEEGHWE